MSKSIIFPVKSFLDNFYRRLEKKFWSHFYLQRSTKQLSKSLNKISNSKFLYCVWTEPKEEKEAEIQQTMTQQEEISCGQTSARKAKWGFKIWWKESQEIINLYLYLKTLNTISVDKGVRSLWLQKTNKEGIDWVGMSWVLLVEQRGNVVISKSKDCGFESLRPTWSHSRWVDYTTCVYTIALLEGCGVVLA